MRYELRLTAFDMLDRVHIGGTVYMTDDGPAEVSRPVLTWTRTVLGTGQSDPVRWTIDSLVAALEPL